MQHFACVVFNILTHVGVILTNVQLIVLLHRFAPWFAQPFLQLLHPTWNAASRGICMNLHAIVEKTRDRVGTP